MGNTLNSLIQITGEFDLKELSQDISCMKNKYIRYQMLKI